MIAYSFTEQALADAVAEIERLRAALEGLVDRLDYVHNDPAYKSVWIINQLHAGPYSGPTYTVDLEKARHAIPLKDKPSIMSDQTEPVIYRWSWEKRVNEIVAIGRAEAIEECAMVVDEMAERVRDDPSRFVALTNTAAAIRALREKP